MSLKKYALCLIRESKEILDILGIGKSIFLSSIILITYFTAINLVDFLKPLQKFKVEFIELLVLLTLFTAGYKAWLKQQIKIDDIKRKEDSETIVISNQSLKITIGSAQMKTSIGKIRMGFTFDILNRKNHRIDVMSVNFDIFEERLRLSNRFDQILFSRLPFPIKIDSKSSERVHITREYSIKDLTFDNQITFLEELNKKTADIIFEINSIEGSETLNIQVTLETKPFLSSLIEPKGANGYGFPQSPIQKSLDRIGY